MEMELPGPSAKRRRRSEDQAAGEPPLRTTEATEAANAGHTTHNEEPPPLPDAGSGGGGGGGDDDDDVDRISGLPDAVLGEILSLLSTKEVGRTQIRHRRLPLLSGSRPHSELPPSTNAIAWIAQWKAFTFPTSRISALKMSASPRAHCIPSSPAALSWSFGVGCLRISSNSLRSIGDSTGYPRDNLQGIDVVSLTTALSNVKILGVGSWRIDLDTAIELLKCFPCLEKLYIKSCSSGERNRWRRKQRDFLKSFDIRLRTAVSRHQIPSQFCLILSTECERVRVNKT